MSQLPYRLENPGVLKELLAGCSFASYTCRRWALFIGITRAREVLEIVIIEKKSCYFLVSFQIVGYGSLDYTFE